jgi:hypothetical protein
VLVTTLPSSALEKPVIEKFSASKLEVDLSDPDLTIEFEVIASHPKGLENDSSLLIFSNSSSITLSVSLIRTDIPIDYAKTRVTYKGKLTLPRSLTPGVYNYEIDGVRNNFDSGTRFPTGIIKAPRVRDLKGAESGILVRSNGFLNLNYETINGPTFGSQSGITYLNPSKYTGVADPIWKVGEVFNPNDYFELSVSTLELSISSSTPKVCLSNGKTFSLIAEGDCQYKVFTKNTKDYIEKFKSLSATISSARIAQELKIENISPLKPSALPVIIQLSPVYASGISAVEYVMPKSITPSICEASGYILKIVNSGECRLTYKTDGNAQFLPSQIFVQNIEILKDNLPIAVQIPTPTPSATAIPKIQKTISCIKGKTIKKRTGTNPKCPSGYKKK